MSTSTTTATSSTNTIVNTSFLNLGGTLSSVNEKNKIESVFLLQEELKRQIGNVKINLEKEGKRRTLQTLINRLNNLQNKWEEFKNNHRLIIVNPNIDRNLPYFFEDHFALVEESFIIACDSIQSAMTEFQPPPNQQQQQQQQQQQNQPRLNNAYTLNENELRLLLANNNNNTELRLPRITIPTFSGNYFKWTAFHDLFKSMIHDKVNLSPVQKCHYLKSNISGEAKQLIEHLQISDANYLTAWQSLVERYQNKRILVHSYIKTLFNQTKIATPNAYALRNLVDKTRECINSLENLDIDVSSWDPIIVYNITEKLDPETLRLWEQSLQDPKELTSYEMITKFLEIRFQSVEMMQSSTQSISSSSSPIYDHRVQSNNNTSFSLPQKKKECSYCGSVEHSIFKCSSFNNVSESNRLKWAQNTARCTNCLQQTHNVYNCSSKNRCSVCKRNHHTLLHIQKQQFSSSRAPHSHTNTQTYNQASCNIARNAPFEMYNLQSHGCTQTQLQPNQCNNNNMLTSNQNISSNPCIHHQQQSAPSTVNMREFNHSSNQNTSNQYQSTNMSNQSPVHKAEIHTSRSAETSQFQNLEQSLQSSKENHYQHNNNNKNSYSSTNSTSNNYFNTPGSSSNGFQNINSYSAIISSRNPVLLATALIEIPDSFGILHTFRALIDPGSEATFITEAAAQLLKLPRLRSTNIISGISNGTKPSTSTMIIKICSKINTKFATTITALILPQITSLLPNRKVSINYNLIQGLNLADPFYNTPRKIDVLIGADSYGNIILSGLRKAHESAIIAQQTELGWVLTGNSGNQTNQTDSYSSFHITVDNTLDKLLTRFWEVENVHDVVLPKNEDLMCETIYNDTTQRNMDGTYTVSLPFKNNTKPTLGLSRDRAVARLLTMEKTFKKNPQLKEQYVQFMNEYISLGHAQEVTCSMFNELSNSRQYYMPHQAVIRESSTTTKLRVVFDASTKTSSGVSLNDVLLSGPSLQADLYSIILRWRRHRIVITADIEKMYRQIKINPSDIEYQRIVWRNSYSEPIKNYNLLTITYGTSSAPYLAIKTLRRLAKDDRHLFPAASKAVLNDFYVDDLMSGGNNEQEIIKLKNEIYGLLSGGGFRIRKWSSNSNMVLETIPEIDRAPKTIFNMEGNEDIKTLGLFWNPETDCFNFKVSLPLVGNKKITKRMILSISSMLFDPIGWLAPTIIIFKLLLQKLWLIGVSWDEEVPIEVRTVWENVLEKLSAIETIRIPRWIGTQEMSSTIELHGFCDASSKAFAAVIYTRVIDINGGIKTTLLTSKTRVAPIKVISIPRLELCAATLLKNLSVKTKLSLEFSNIDITLWSDSMIVLAWLRNHSCKYKTFVANRVSEIQQEFNASCWKYVPSAENPADCATRGVNPSDLDSHKLWWGGPNWLSQNRNTWNKWPISTDTEIDVKPNHLAVLTTTLQLDVIKKFSNFSRLQKVIAYCLRFVFNAARKSAIKKVDTLSIEELTNAKKSIVKFVQRDIYGDEINRLLKKLEISTKSKLITLNPFLDEDGLLRVGGRLRRSNYSINTKHPIILPDKHHVTWLLINKAHLETLHGGAQLTLSQIRNEYWITNGRNAVRHQIFKCVKCFRHRTTYTNQIMGDLPAARINISRPFTHVGVDYAGPINIRISKGRGTKTHKGYICVFVCLCTKAVHLEVVTDLTSDTFIAAFQRFIGRRGRCTNIYSDNGTNFVGADRQLKAERLKYYKDHRQRLKNQFTKEGITWHFIPPASPNFGGLWEAAVKSVKYHLKRILGETSLTYEEFATVLIRIEACLNSRPLCSLTEDPDDLQVLTPGHFLIGSSLLAIPEQNTLDRTPSSLKRWELTTKLYQQFWQQWSKEYLNTLQQRPKKYSIKVNDPKINDMVIVKDDHLPPTQWSLGRIVNVHPGVDEVSRVFTIKTENNVCKRSISKVCLLPIDDNFTN